MSALVSVIIPCYRQGRFLSESVRSALTQQGAHVEVVVVNDGSDDETLDVARLFGDQIRIVSQSNGGLSAARNAGINASTGQYLYFLDADDRLRPSGLQALLSAARYDTIVLGRFEYFVDHGSVPLARNRPLEPLMDGLGDEEALLVGNLAPPCAWLCSRDAVMRIGCFRSELNYRGCEDWDLWSRLVFDGLRIKRVSAVVAEYRLHASSMTAKTIKRMEATDAELLQRNLLVLGQLTSSPCWLKSSPALLAKRVRAKLRRSLINACYLHRRDGELRAACHALRSAVTATGMRSSDLMEAGKIAVSAFVGLPRLQARPDG